MCFHVASKLEQPGFARLSPRSNINWTTHCAVHVGRPMVDHGHDPYHDKPRATPWTPAMEQPMALFMDEPMAYATVIHGVALSTD